MRHHQLSTGVDVSAPDCSISFQHLESCALPVKGYMSTNLRQVASIPSLYAVLNTKNPQRESWASLISLTHLGVASRSIRSYSFNLLSRFHLILSCRIASPLWFECDAISAKCSLPGFALQFAVKKAPNPPRKLALLRRRITDPGWLTRIDRVFLICTPHYDFASKFGQSVWALDCFRLKL